MPKQVVEGNCKHDSRITQAGTDNRPSMLVGQSHQYLPRDGTHDASRSSAIQGTSDQNSCVLPPS